MRTLRARHEDTLYGGALTKRCMCIQRRLVLERPAMARIEASLDSFRSSKAGAHSTARAPEKLAASSIA
ncbi:hypothetical protein [Paenibacillus elgii]|uniref:hypothetical protein n=1 Tax=Paenibacillus elgii TaxID=189691 RepID=UPI0011B2776F|nr:hypothetical protein [Paenibacillus elgii]